MDATRLYHVPGPRSTRVLWMLEEAGTPFELAVIKPDDHLGDEHLKRHPLDRVPAADTADGPLFEAAALVLQIADANPQAGLIAPPGSHERALQYRWACSACTEIEPGFVEFYRHRDPALIERVVGVPGAEVLIAYLSGHGHTIEADREARLSLGLPRIPPAALRGRTTKVPLPVRPHPDDPASTRSQRWRTWTGGGRCRHV